LDTHFYKIIFDVVPYALLVLDRELRVVICNRSSESFLLKSSREMIGKKTF